MKSRAWIGNDIVDLAEPNVPGKEQDRRFMDRVFTPEERARILDAAAPTLALWKTWSAKETAFKIASKIREGLVFHHQAFEVEMLDADRTASRAWTPLAAFPSLASASQRARVRFDDLEIRVRWEMAREYIHCIGHLRDPEEPSLLAAPGLASRGLDLAHDWQGFVEYLRERWRVMSSVAHNSQALGGRLSWAEQASVHSTASERARLLARRLMERWDLQEAEVVRLWRQWGWSPPVVAREGRPVAGFDVTLSHDGRFVAAVVTGPV